MKKFNRIRDKYNSTEMVILGFVIWAETCREILTHYLIGAWSPPFSHYRTDTNRKIELKMTVRATKKYPKDRIEQVKKDMVFLSKLLVGLFIKWYDNRTIPQASVKDAVVIHDNYHYWGHSPPVHEYTVIFKGSGRIAHHKYVLHLVLGLLRDALDIAVFFPRNVEEFRKLCTEEKLDSLLRSKDSEKIVKLLKEALKLLADSTYPNSRVRPINTDRCAILCEILDVADGYKTIRKIPLPKREAVRRGYWEKNAKSFLEDIKKYA